MNKLDQAKKMAGERAVQFVEDGMVVGLGTGSTSVWAVRRLGERVQEEGLNIQAIGTSRQTEELARKAHIPLVTFAEVKELDLAIDGADELAHDWSLTKGGGGALLREKLVASSACRFFVIIDQTKRVHHLGRFLLPVEVVPFGWELTQSRIQRKRCRAQLRGLGDRQQPFVTDNGNYILDCDFKEILDPASLHHELKALPGVVESGLFIDMVYAVIESDGIDVSVEYKNPHV